MCGIIAYVGAQQCVSLLLEGLSRLEYRGYDSAGIAVMERDSTTVRRAEGKLTNLKQLLTEKPLAGTVGVAHTRWATHGRPSERNAHPHKYGKVTVVHNGIIENHNELRSALRNSGHEFSSDTDTEVVAHLLDEELRRGKIPLVAVTEVLRSLQGSFALCFLIDGYPNQVIAARRDAPLILGLGQGENYVASDVPALLHRTRDIIFLEQDEIAVIQATSVRVTNVEGKVIDRVSTRITWDASMAEKGGFKHFMAKEIHEQPRVVADTMGDRVMLSAGDVRLDDFEFNPDVFKRITIVGCGTSYHSGLVGKYMIESLARVPVDVELASEFRYRDPLVDGSHLVIPISQSGETADTLAALREATRRGVKSLAICNVVGASIAREAASVLYTHAGPEVGVASTKAFTAQLTALLMLAVHCGRRTQALNQHDAEELLKELASIPEKIRSILDRQASIGVVARRYVNARDFIYLGRGINYPIALEGALKLKEISYIHAEGYAAGEMKHGPIALIDESTPVVVIAPKGSGYEKIVNNLQEVRARQGKVIAIASHGDSDIEEVVDDVIQIPCVRPELQPFLTVVPLQLLAYRIADSRGTDVDQPRNLAKSVTVE